MNNTQRQTNKQTILIVAQASELEVISMPEAFRLNKNGCACGEAGSSKHRGLPYNSSSNLRV